MRDADYFKLVLLCVILAKEVFIINFFWTHDIRKCTAEVFLLCELSRHSTGSLAMSRASPSSALCASMRSCASVNSSARVSTVLPHALARMRSNAWRDSVS